MAGGFCMSAGDLLRISGLTGEKMMTRICRIEALESRRLFTAVFPTNAEQYMLELVNRARANPSAEAAMDGIALNEGLPAGTISAAAKQPLAFNPFLIDSARKHSHWMNVNNTFSHFESATNDPTTRMKAAGYTFTGSWGDGENIAEVAGIPAPALNPTVLKEENGLFIDKTEPGRGHRTNILDPSFKEIGIGLDEGPFKVNGTTYTAVMATQDFAYSGTGSFLTGVVYKDANKNKFYDPGEGLGGVTIKAVRSTDHATFSTTAWASGGYTLKLGGGTYTVTASGGAFGTAVSGKVTIGALNVEADFNPAPPPATISGTVFDDANKDGKKESTEAGLGNWKVYIDANNNGKLDAGEKSVTTSSTGAWSFGSLAAGTYIIRIVQQTGFTRTTPAGGSYTITVAAGATVGGKLFGEHKP